MYVNRLTLHSLYFRSHPPYRRLVFDDVLRLVRVYARRPPSPSSRGKTTMGHSDRLAANSDDRHGPTVQQSGSRATIKGLCAMVDPYAYRPIARSWLDWLVPFHTYRSSSFLSSPSLLIELLLHCLVCDHCCRRHRSAPLRP
jgi:hypothetical protein